MSAALALATLLQSASIGRLGEDLFYGRGLSDIPDTQVAVQQYGGFAPEQTMTATLGRVVAERPRCQIVSRSKEYLTAEANARLAWTALINYKAAPGAGAIMYVSPVQSPFYMGIDEQNRCKFGFNADVWVQGD